MTVKSESFAVMSSSLRLDKSDSSIIRPSMSDRSWSMISGLA